MVPALIVILKLVICVLASIILILLSTVNFQFQGWFVSISWGQFSQLCQLMSWLQSGHHIVNFSAWWGFQYLQDSSQDMAQNIIYSPWEGTKKEPCLMVHYYYLLFFDCFSLFLCFLTSLIKLILWLKFFFFPHRQKAGRGWGVQGP